MSGTLPIVLIVVVWLFVLTPIALRGRKPIRHTNEAFEETRVIHAGGEELQAQRRRPRLTPADIHVSQGTEEDLEYVEPDDILIDTDADAPRIGDRIGHAFGRFGRAKTAEISEDHAPQGTAVRVDSYDVVDGAVVAELPRSKDLDQEPGDAVPVSAFEDDEEYDTYPYDDAYLSPADFLHDDATYEMAETYEPEYAEEDNVEESFADDELSVEDLEFAARRRGRGGYDPEADAEATAQRFKQRQRTLLILVAAVLISAVVAAVLGGLVWIAPAVAVILTAVYLFALRQQVQQEQALRARRIRHMRRARMGVRSAESQELGLPSRLRRPGAVVLELDDDSADFADLPETQAAFDQQLGHHAESEPRRVG